MQQFIKFKGGTNGARVYICPSQVSSVQDNVGGDSNLTDINTADGKTHSVQGDVDGVATAIKEAMQ